MEKQKKTREEKLSFTTTRGYAKLIGSMPRLMALLKPGIFKKQNQKWLNRLKEFAEKHCAGCWQYLC